jgi:uncharacterized membrane protein YbhN (UPF0104 family)
MSSFWQGHTQGSGGPSFWGAIVRSLWLWRGSARLNGLAWLWAAWPAHRRGVIAEKGRRVRNHRHVRRTGLFGNHTGLSIAELGCLQRSSQCAAGWALLAKACWVLTWWVKGEASVPVPVAMMLCPEMPPQSTSCAFPWDLGYAQHLGPGRNYNHLHIQQKVR